MEMDWNMKNSGQRLQVLILRLQKSPKNDRYVSGNLPTDPSPKLTCCLKWEVSVNVGLGEG